MDAYQVAAADEPEPETIKTPWHPFEPPFNAQPPAGSDMVAGIRFKQEQMSAALKHGLAERTYVAAAAAAAAACCLLLAAANVAQFCC
jgi:hypothetical protein